MASEKKYKSFWSFYPYYLTEHGDLTNRTLHFIGTAGLLVILIMAIVLQKWWMLALIRFAVMALPGLAIILLKKINRLHLRIPYTAWVVTS